MVRITRDRIADLWQSARREVDGSAYARVLLGSRTKTVRKR